MSIVKNNPMETIKHNLKDLICELIAAQPEIDSLYLFGSRAYGTGSTRSDCDILVGVAPGDHVRSSDLRDFSMQQCPALDFFIAAGGHAVSCMNDSYVYADSFDELARRLDAILLWSKASGFQNISVDWVFETRTFVEFVPTSLPNASLNEFSWQTIVKRTDQARLPSHPYIGDTIDKATAMITEVARRMIFRSSDLGQRGVAKDGWTVDLASEYDCQNLFYTVIKPWIPGIGREEITIRYDGQDKIADFNLFDSKLIVEMKFIDGDSKKREVVKTLDGLGRFYSQNSNIKILLFFIFVKEGVSVDATRWASDYTFSKNSPQVLTHVIYVP